MKDSTFAFITISLMSLGICALAIAWTNMRDSKLPNCATYETDKDNRLVCIKWQPIQK